ncbi:MAG: RDD family protein [Gammaproteobacteria bacterium]|nr:RDD family protein [Gammaproteobacteria bacterium]
MSQARPLEQYPNASFIRRLAALVYDFFLVVAIWMLSTTLLVAVVADGEAIEGWPFQLFLYAELFAFYYVFWRIKGQTLGMQVWKIRAVNERGEIMNGEQCVLRFLAATISLLPLGLGMLWILLNRENLALHDLATNTRIVYLGDKPYNSERV